MMSPGHHASLLADLQANGLGSDAALDEGGGRRGGAGPTDHRAVTIAGRTVMVPMRSSKRQRYHLKVVGGATLLTRDGVGLAPASVPETPRFYAGVTADGVPYTKIALLHSRKVLASTIMQSCVRYNDPANACQFCAIGTSLEAGRTLPRKSPAQIAEVATAAVRLDGVEQLVLTTGTPATPDRGAAHLAACVAAVKAAVPSLPIQVQCEPPDDFAWFERLRAAGADTLGMHLEAVEPAVRARVMPGKAELPLERYFEAFAAAVPIFGRGQVSTYLIAGLGDAADSLVNVAERLLAMGVYPFVVPFVPLVGTSMEDHPPPEGEAMQALYERVGSLIRRYQLFSAESKAGCAKCGACSALAAYEVEA